MVNYFDLLMILVILHALLAVSMPNILLVNTTYVVYNIMCLSVSACIQTNTQLKQTGQLLEYNFLYF